MSAADRVFMMGQFAARLPADRLYARNHMWAQPATTGVRFGLTAYAVRLLQDVYFLEWTVDMGVSLRDRQAIGNIESSKAESELYAPVPGRLREFNAQLLRDPSAINVDAYGDGWLFEFDADGLDMSGHAALLDVDAYLAHLAEAWKVAERTIKGQINESD